MKKIKTVCEETGLSEKAIRLYIKEGLIEPNITEGINYKSYSFTDKNVAELKDISILRNAGFSIDDIKIMKTYPERIHLLVEERQNIIAKEIFAQQKIETALLGLASSEKASTKDLAQAVEPYIVHDEYAGKTHSARNFKFIIIFMVLLSGVICYMFKTIGLFGVEIVGSLVLAVLAIICIIYSTKIFCVTNKARKYRNRSSGVVVDIVENHGFNVSYSRAGSNYAGTSENGIGGVWQIIFMIWNEIRFDCYYPVVGFYTGDKYCLAQLQFGWLKNAWEIEQTIEIAWDNDTEYILPLEGRWIISKALTYLIVGVIFSVTSVVLQVFVSMEV